MTNKQVGLYLGLVDFYDPTLLILGDPNAFLWFSKQIATRLPFILEGVPGTSYASLQFVPSAGDGCLTRQGNAFEWKISALESEQVAMQLESFSVDGAGHHYLDPTFNETNVEVRASRGEYDANDIFR